MRSRLVQLFSVGKGLRRLLQLAATLLVLFWLLVAMATAVFHTLIVPRAPLWRDDLAQALSRWLDASVSLTALQAESVDGVPTVRLKGLRIRDAQGQEGLHIEQAEATLSARSLLNLGFDQVHLRGVNVQVARDEAGVWHIGGVRLPAARSAQPSWFMNWLFQQNHARVDDARVHWRDAWWARQQGLAQVPELRWDDVHAVLRNQDRHHRWRIDATPSVAPQQVWTLRGDLRSPALSRAVGDTAQWSGQVFMHAAGVDLGLLNQHIDARDWLGLESASGRGDWRAWLEMQRGHVLAVTNDWALHDVRARLRRDLKPLALRDLSGRLTVYQPEGGWRIETHGLAFATTDGLEWPGGDLQWRQHDASDAQPQRQQLTATDMDLAAMGAVVSRLPLPEALLQQWQALQPSGRVDSLQADWLGPWEAPQGFRVQARVRDFGVQPGRLPAGAGPGDLARPGVRGLNLRLQADAQGGEAELDMSNGRWWLPGVWDDPELVLGGLKTALSWSRVQGQWQVRARDVRLFNADVQARGDVTWTDGPGAGHLDLDLVAQRANLARLSRYLPRVLDAEVRRYLALALQQGQARDVKVRIQGPADELPFAQADSGVFQIDGQVEGLRFDVAPKAVVGQQWMRLSKLSGRYSQNNTRLRLSGVRARWDGQEALVLSDAEAEVSDLATRPQLRVQGQAKGPLEAWMAGVRSTALQGLLGEALDGVQARGDGALQLDLALALHGDYKSKVSGHFDFSKARVEWSPDLPVATQAKGRVSFDEQGVQVIVPSAQLLGGAARVGVRIAEGRAWQAQVQGDYSVAALRQWPRLQAALPGLASASGASDYRLQMQGRADQVSTWTLDGGLKGVALDLPAPLGKSAAQDWRVQWRQQAAEHVLSVGPGQAPVLHARWQVAAPRWRGFVAVGPRARALVSADAAQAPMTWWLRTPQLDLDAWQNWWAQAAPPAAPSSAAGSPAWWPIHVYAQADQVQAGGWDFEQVEVQARDEGSGWRAEVQADEFAGWLRIEPPSATQAKGRLLARLKRLRLTPSAVEQVETALTEQPRELPALDVQVDDFELKGRAWGQVSLRANNEVISRGGRRIAQWRLTELQAQTPEATLSASGLWAPVDGGLNQAAQGLWRRTQLDVKLQVRDSGALLTRFDMPGVIRGGAGQVNGQLSWQGSPLNFDTKSLSGYLHLDVGTGQFLKADPGIAKLLGVLSLQSLPRRLLLDFRDVFNAGFEFDRVQGRAQMEAGILYTRDLSMRGPNATVLIEGQANLVQENQDLQVVVLPQLDAGTLSLWAGLTNPVLGLASYVAQKVFGNVVASANVRAMHVSGTWQDPQVQTLRTGQTQAPAPVRDASTPAAPALKPLGQATSP
jgi:uncharacterized protein (TIGR02099 family)